MIGDLQDKRMSMLELEQLDEDMSDEGAKPKIELNPMVNENIPVKKPLIEKRPMPDYNPSKEPIQKSLTLGEVNF